MEPLLLLSLLPYLSFCVLGTPQAAILIKRLKNLPRRYLVARREIHHSAVAMVSKEWKWNLVYDILLVT